MQGRLLFEKEQLTTGEIHLKPGLPAGIYHLRVSDEKRLLKLFRIQRAQQTGGIPAPAQIQTRKAVMVLRVFFPPEDRNRNHRDTHVLPQ